MILHIRKGVKFASGEELKASDVLFTIQNAQAGTGASDSFQKILLDKSEIVDEYTLKLVTDGPVATLIAGLQLPDTGILSEKAFQECGGDYLKLAETGGSGPYKLVSYTPGDRIVLAANENYWREGEPYYKELIMRFVTDASSRAIEAKTGNADIVCNIASKDIEEVKNAAGMNFVSESGAQTVYLVCNTQLAPMDNDLVRQPVHYHDALAGRSCRTLDCALRLRIPGSHRNTAAAQCTTYIWDRQFWPGYFQPYFEWLPLYYIYWIRRYHHGCCFWQRFGASGSILQKAG